MITQLHNDFSSEYNRSCALGRVPSERAAESELFGENRVPLVPSEPLEGGRRGP